MVGKTCGPLGVFVGHHFWPSLTPLHKSIRGGGGGVLGIRPTSTPGPQKD